MLRALRRLIGLGRQQEQLSFDLESAPRDATELRERLVRLGLDPQYRCRLTSNRTVFVSYAGNELRIHRGYLDATEDSWRAIVAFVQAKSRAARAQARRELLSRSLDLSREGDARTRRPAEKTHADDQRLVERLRREHQLMNAEKFGGVLTTPPIRVSRRMKSRLGHYSHRRPSGEGGEIVISRRHIRRHGWEQALETLVHEMVHQWQDENGLTVDHGRHFRAKARAVGISPLARRDVA